MREEIVSCIWLYFENNHDYRARLFFCLSLCDLYSIRLWYRTYLQFNTFQLNFPSLLRQINAISSPSMSLTMTVFPEVLAWHLTPGSSLLIASTYVDPAQINDYRLKTNIWAIFLYREFIMIKYIKNPPATTIKLSWKPWYKKIIV